MRVPSAIAIGSLCLALLAPDSASAFCLNKVSGTTPYASWQKFPVKYKVSKNLTDAKIIKAIDDAFATWGAVACSKLKFQKDGTFDIATNKFDAHGQEAILVYWYTAAAGWPTDPKYVAYTFIGHDNAGGLAQASIAVNAFTATYPWATDGDKAKLDVQAEVTTLIGQVIGLTTSNSKASVMQSTINFGDVPKRTLGPDDKDALHHLYNEANCPAGPVPGANGCTGSAPAPDGGVPPTDGSTPPKTDGGVVPPKTDGSTPPKNDTGVTKFDTGGTPPFVDSGGVKQCSSNAQCATDEVCTIQGKCQKIGGGGDDGGCCSVAADAPPPGMLLLIALLAAVWLGTRRRG